MIVVCLALSPLPAGGQDAAVEDAEPAATAPVEPAAPLVVGSPAPLREPELNFYGLPGLVDMPSGEAMPDAELATTVSNFAGTTRATLAFQVTPRIAGSFRYTELRNWNSGGFGTFYDRSFDLRFLLLTEDRLRPAVTLGIQDFIGTGLYSAEYLAASKTFGLPAEQSLTLTGGLGWGRLGTDNVIGSIGDRPDPEIDTGGEPNLDTLFRGDIGVFGGVVWRPVPALSLKAELSSDGYDREAGELDIFDRDSPFNFGAEYQVNPDLRVGVYSLYGTELGLAAQFTVNPKVSPNPGIRDAAPPPVLQRPDPAETPEFYTTDWVGSERVRGQVRDQAAEGFRDQRLELVALDLGPEAATAYFRNGGYQAPAQALGRAARVMSRTMPSSIDRFTLVQTSRGLSLPAVSFTRDEVERFAVAPDGAERVLAAASYDTTPPRPEREDYLEGIYPRATWAIGPDIRTSFFDPDNPARADLAVQLLGIFEPAPGVRLAGTLRKSVVGNLDDVERESNSELPRVRSDFAEYDENGDPGISNLYGAYYFQPGGTVYGRVTAGLLERMHGGVSGELLWAPFDSRLALGTELNYSRQRDFEGFFGFQDYDVVTGYASAYWRFDDDFFGQIDAGRYLAGDYGATFSLTRQFPNGWQVGAFATLTDVTGDEFGEGSFDKGITLSIPVEWLLNRSSRVTADATLRPLTRDGGARLSVPGRLYGQVIEGRRLEVEEQWGRFWR